MEENTPSGTESKTIILFILIAFGITWLCWIPALVGASRQGFALPTINNFARVGEQASLTGQQRLLTSLFSFAVYGPLIAAVALTFWETGKEGLVDLLRRIVKFHIPLKWYGITVGLVLVISFIPRIMAQLTGQMMTGAVVWTLPLAAALLLRQILTSGLGEEPGWRGFLLPRLQSLYGSGRAVWILGTVWAVWHYPFTIFETLTNMVDVPVGPMVITLVMSLAGQTMSLIGMTYLYVWIYNHTQSVWLVILFHALSNAVPAVLLSGVSPSFNILMAVIPWLLVLVLEKLVGKEDFPGKTA
jgi:membrane protease YdiL (CAAX protease family)